MFDSPILELLVGLVVIYLLFSLVASAVNEALASAIRFRPIMLKAGIQKLLDGGLPKSAKKSGSTPLASGGTATPKEPRTRSAGEAFYSHPLIESLTARNRRKPSYISKETFSTVLLDLIAPGNESRGPAWKLSAVHEALFPGRSSEMKRTEPEPKPDDRLPIKMSRTLHASLATLFETVGHQTSGAKDRLAAFKTAIENWFDEGMERVSGRYKRWTQFSIFCIAAGLTISLNIDSVAIVHALYKNPSLRQSLSSQASLLAKEGAAGAGNSNGEIHSLLTKLEGLDLPLGWGSSKSSEEKQSKDQDKDQGKDKAKEAPAKDAQLKAAQTKNPQNKDAVPDSDAINSTKLLGFLITIFAISLGAPFWFDVLNKLVSLRSTGKKEETAPVKKAEDEADSKRGAPAPTAVAVAGPGMAAAPLAALHAEAAASDEWLEDSIEAGVKMFDPLATSYSDRNALALGKAAVVAYKDLDVAARIVTSVWGFKEFLKFNQGSTQAFVAGKHDAVIAAFRGTEPKELEDILADARFSLVARSSGAGNVHLGFKKALEAVIPGMQDELKELLSRMQGSSGNPPTVWVTGHSLGAALATLFSLGLEETGITVRGLYTFGSPRVGDQAFCDAFGRLLSDRTFRFVNHEDLVTRVAPRALKYAHVGTVKYFDADGLLHDDPAQWTVFLNSVLEAVEDFKLAAKSTVKDHAMALYLRKLENLAARGA